ncbi:EGF-like domain-containing protein comC [Anthonomus grandis grandis]|uniref:EGF-like domain-containing protein comC n=1 Tax=Anthonomus grandis grandis TaxID=2921223 RepID=UPI0021653526|nr:EGF-like domain-containing protein comC [Anthonomus grandis grandis]
MRYFLLICVILYLCVDVLFSSFYPMAMKLYLWIVLIHFSGINAINETCTNNENCTVSEKSVCIDNVCSCDALYTFNSELNKCVKYSTEFGSICTDVNECSLFLGNNSACTHNVCVCKEGYTWYQGKCQQYATKGDKCSSDKICLDHSNPLSLKCSKNGVCVCNDDYYDRGQDCRKKGQVNGECAISMDCSATMANSYCGLGKCINNTSLQHLMIDNEFKPVSLKEDLKLDNVVLSSLTEIQCNDSANTVYFQDEICICAPGFFLFNNRCIAELGMMDTTVAYQNDSDCPIKPGKLSSDGICYCKEYWFQDETNRECKKTTLEYTRSCMDNDWCKAMGPYAFCNSATGKCECSSISTFNATSFYCNYDGTNLTDVCLSDWECPLYESCKDQKCQCDDGFFKVNESGLCLPKIGYSCKVRDCDHIDGAICNSETEVCTCENTSYVNDEYQCLPQVTSLNEECQIDEQCQSMHNSGCLSDKNNITRCLCNDEYREVNDKCYLIRSPGSLCSTETDCTAILGETFVCRNMLCQCPLDKYLNQDNVCAKNATTHARLDKWTLYLMLGFLTNIMFRIIL